MKQGTIDTLDQAKEIAEEYDGNLTVRQLYYRLVAGGHIPNSVESYKRIVSVLTDARYSGEFPIEWLLDRTREAKPGFFKTNQDDVEDALASTAADLRGAPESWLYRDRWFRQPKHVSVWVEKEALAGVFDAPCEDTGVSSFVCRGYSSVSALSQWLDALVEAHVANAFDEAVVLYFGDHDPDGWEIPRSAERNLQKIIQVRALYVPPIRFIRTALLRPQIQAFSPPPFPAKESSARFAGYVREHADAWGWESDSDAMAWELDALAPRDLDALIRRSVAQHFDTDIHDDNVDTIGEKRGEMRERMQEEGWVRGALDGTS